jgi:hypothetical protein
MKFLFNSRLAPLMNRVAFVDGNIEQVVEAFLAWYQPLIERREWKLDVRKEQVTFEEALGRLEPLEYPEKHIFMTTKSKWIAFTDNRQQAEIGRIRQVSKRLDVQSVEVGAWERNVSDNPKSVNGWGGGYFTLNQGNDMTRSVSLMYNDKWDFDEYGEPLPFENMSAYKEKLAKNRLTPAMVDQYCKEIGIDLFNEDFYLPEKVAYVIETVGPRGNQKSLSLSEVRKSYQWE